MLPATIQSINQAFREVKTFIDEPWDGDYRQAARKALKDLLHHQMNNRIDRYLQQMQAQGIPDRRNGSFHRHLLTELGDLELKIPRTRTFSPIALLKNFARRAAPVERLILLAFTLGLSTRKVGRALLPILGEPISATTVSRVSRQLDAAVEAFHCRRLLDQYQILILDGIVLKRKTGLGAQKRAVLVALGIRGDGKREIIDFHQASSESQPSWEAFLHSLYRRGLEGKALQLIIVDGGKGLGAALPFAYPTIPVQRCWAHKTRNILDYVRKADQPDVKDSLQQISHARSTRQALKAAQAFRDEWEELYPKAVACLQEDLPELLTFYRVLILTPLKASALRTTNAIERRFREVRRRTRPMGVFSDHTSIDRIMFAVFTHENSKEGTHTPFLMTQIN